MHASIVWMRAGDQRDQRRRSAATAISVCRRIDNGVGAGSEERFGDFDGIGWNDLVFVFNTVGRNVVGQRRAVMTRRAHDRQVFVRVEQAL